MYARNTFELSRRHPNPFPPLQDNVLLIHWFPLFADPYFSMLVYLHTVAHSSRFHTTPNARAFSCLRTLQQKTGGKYGHNLTRFRPSPSTFNFELSTSSRVTPVIPALTNRMALTSIISTLTQIRGVGGDYC